MPEETKAAPLAPILTPGKRGEEVEEDEEEGEKEEEAREKLLGRVGRSGCPAPVAMTIHGRRLSKLALSPVRNRENRTNLRDAKPIQEGKRPIVLLG
jgi:hypothetical protein